MSSHPIDERRLQTLSDAEPRDDGDYVLYWMEASQRAKRNEALEFAVSRANEHNKRLLVAYILDPDEPDTNGRHVTFALQGLRETAGHLAERDIKFALRKGTAPKAVGKLAGDAVEVICDRGYLRHQRDWRESVAESAGCRVWQVEANVVVPVETASDDREYAARTIRGQLEDLRGEFLGDLETVSLGKYSKGLSVDGESLDSAADIERLVDGMSFAEDVPASDDFTGGHGAASSRLGDFLDRLKDYGEERDDINAECCSHLSPYLRFGQISPVEIATSLGRHGSKDDRDEFLEELIVRRELAANFVFYETDYDSPSSLPDWAAETLDKHKSDDRDSTYTAAELENADTDDRLWNAAMTEMKQRGWIHNFLRMYWGKQLLRYTNTPRYAHEVMLKLNNRYFLDGRDPNSFANTLWCLGLHDRAWGESDVFGKVRKQGRGAVGSDSAIETYCDRILGEEDE